MACFVKGIFSEKYLTTVGVRIDMKAVSVGEREVKIILWDIEGQDEYQKLRTAYLTGASGLILVADGTRRDTLEEVLSLYRGLGEPYRAVPFILMLNEVD